MCEDFGAETGFAKDPTNDSEVLTEHSPPMLKCSRDSQYLWEEAAHGQYVGD